VWKELGFRKQTDSQTAEAAFFVTTEAEFFSGGT